MLKRIFRIITTVFVIMIVLAGISLLFLVLGKDTAINLEIGTVNLAEIPDGVYEGNYSGMRWSNTVEVTVEDHRIAAIEVAKKQLINSAQVMDTLIPRIIEAQNVDVDVVTGATADSKAYLKAIENALTLN